MENFVVCRQRVSRYIGPTPRLSKQRGPNLNVHPYGSPVPTPSPTDVTGWASNTVHGEEEHRRDTTLQGERNVLPIYVTEVSCENPWTPRSSLTPSSNPRRTQTQRRRARGEDLSRVLRCRSRVRDENRLRLSPTQIRPSTPHTLLPQDPTHYPSCVLSTPLRSSVQSTTTVPGRTRGRSPQPVDPR